MKYRREIDGLRALAVVPVILFHAGFETFSGGFVGVDVFFVISGYLITTIILTELEQDKFSIVNFYERRARRILPALFLVMLVCIPFAWFWLLPSAMKDFSQSLVAVSVFASNILFWRESGYFAPAAELKPLLHTWSLAVEEQYYLIFPLFLMLTWRLGKRWILVLLVAVFIASFATAQWASIAKPAAAFYLLPTRGWELLIGAFAAFYLSKSNRTEFARSVGEICGWLGLVLILYAVFAYSKTTPFPGVYALAPTVGTVLIILFATQQTTIGQFVGNKAFVGVGLISYSAYLWHQPLFAFARERSLTEPSQLVFGILSLAALVLAYFTWRFVEAPFRKKGTFNRFKIFLYASIASIFFIIFGLVGNFYQEKITSVRFNENQIFTITSASLSPKRLSCHFPRTDQALEREPCKYFSDNVKVAVIGNSHATELAYSLATILKSKDVGIVQHTMSGCNHNYNVPSESDSICGKWHSKVMKNLISDKSINVVILSYRNEQSLNESKYRQSLADIANELVDSGKRVVLVLQAPMPISHIDRYLSKHISDLSISISSRKLSDWQNLYAQSTEMVKLLKDDVKVFDPAELFCDFEFCYVTKHGVSLFFDDDHVSVAGGKVIGAELVKRYLSDF
jgi:peptidoglycan/LPS O-acetylase OafA/YrhL